jgi:AMMECR1 domain-containing protein
MTNKDEQGKVLLNIARAAIIEVLHTAPYAISDVHEHMSWLSKPGATFVTLTQRGELRGCIGSLQACNPLIDDSEADALAQLRPNVDGIVFEYGSYRSTFLPQVWENLPQPQQFLAQLKRKARVPENFWAEDVKLSRYTVSKWCETDFAKECVHG